jgi:Mtf2 family
MNEEVKRYQDNTFVSPYESKGRRTRPAKWHTSTQSKSPLPDTDEKQFFKDLLDSLLDGPSPSNSLPKLNETSIRMNNKGFSKIEQQLRDMALNPRPASYRSTKSATLQDIPKRKSIRDIEGKDEIRSLWHEPVQQRDAVKDEEFRELGRISELKTGLDLSEYALTKLFQSNSTSDERYPKYLAATIKQASSKLQDPYLALSIFQQAKTRGVESYIVGCTTSVYNTILSLRWEHWKDVYGMHALIHEMISNGVSANDGTRRIVQDVVHEMDKDVGIDDVEGDGIKWSVEQRNVANRMRTAVTKFIIK